MKNISNDGSSARLKSKNIESKTNKIKLTDLCPQQKAKIGELIKTLENLKNENHTLNDEIKELKTDLVTNTEEKDELKTQNNSLQKQLEQTKMELEEYHLLLKEKQLEI